MTDKEKDLLLKDLSARLPYGLKAKVYSYWNEDYVDDYIVGIDIENDDALCGTIPGQRCEITLIKPYLFPISSMTEEQVFDFAIVQVENWKGTYPTLSECSAIIDWGYKHHFDVNGLIEKGLAINATGKNIY